MLSDIKRAIDLHAHRFDGAALADDVVFIAVARPLLEALGGQRPETSTFRALYAVLTRDDSVTHKATCARQGIPLRTFQRLKASLDRMVDALSEIDAEDDLPEITVVDGAVFSATYSATVVYAPDGGGCASDGGGCASDGGGCASDSDGCATNGGSCPSNGGGCAPDGGDCTSDGGGCA